MKNGYNNPLAVSLPYQFNSPDEYPTEVLANRFQAWRYIIKDLVSYLREYASVQEEIVRQQIRLQQAVGISAKSIAINHHNNTSHSHNQHHHGGNNSNTNNKEVDLNEINRFFLPIGNGSIQDLPTILTKFHQQNVNNTSKTLKELNSVIIPKLEELRKDLLIKIKEIKNLLNDFKNNLPKELQETKNLISLYYQSIEISNKLEHGSGNHPANEGSSGANSNAASANSTDQFKYDPYLVKVRLDRQLKKQLQEENYLFQAYQNLQELGGKLESIIFMEVQNYISNFLNLINEEYSSIPNFLLPNFNEGFLSKEPSFEWDSFIAKNIPSPSIAMSAVSNSNSTIKNGTFIDLNFSSRKFNDLIINNYNSALNLAVREGHLERRSKFLKNYSRGWYVLTCNFIHEFKTSDRKKDQTPILSILLDSCQVSDHSKNDGKSGGTYKFILTSKLSNGLIHRNQNWVFRTDTYQKMIDWYNDIKTLTSLPTPASRSRYLNKKLKLDTHLNPNLVQPKISRASSIMSGGTTNNNRSLRTVETNQSKMTHGQMSGQVNLGAQSQSDLQSQTNYRLSSTFSNSKHETQSPKLNQLINSDGTIITPVETNEKPRVNTPPIASTPQPKEANQGPNQYHNQQYQPQYQPQLYPQSSQPQYVPMTNIQQATPQQPPLQQPQPQQPPQQQHQTPQPSSQSQDQQPMVLPPNFLPNFQQGYFITNQNGQQVQQFYDPIQQQYYSITQQPAPQGPQPQYFPTSPQPQAQPQFHPSSPQPNGNQGYFYIPGQAPQGQVPQQFGGNLPYPTDDDTQTNVTEANNVTEAKEDTHTVSTEKEQEPKEDDKANGTITVDATPNGSEKVEEKNGEPAPSMNGDEGEISHTVSKLSI